ncbi:NADP-dependent isocitrate dehydrogenase [Candidatus Sumerlaeota bacterium]|nr:NADP-dependent isocitrate dehydrogenase [Candidatus Sumerlaeota bacterium]
MTTKKTPITIAHGDGIGPEIMAATLAILEAAGAQIDFETIEIGRRIYEAGHSSGIEDKSWDSLRRTKVFLKAPITTPQGGGYKSLNVTIRKTLGLYANVRPCVAYHPFVDTKFPAMDLVIVRENEEDTYAGIEYRQTDDVAQCLKLITRPGSEKICRYAFEYARSHKRRKLSLFIKDNIMKLTDGLFHKVFDEIGDQYPDLPRDSWIVDIGAARLADTPEIFDILVMPNLYGDIMSDIAAQISGSVGLGASANIGDHVAMFEAIHGSAPDIAGKGIANPSGLLLSAVLMLNHIEQYEAATKVHNAWLKTLEDGIHTGDIFDPQKSKRRVGTADFTAAVIERLGQVPAILKAVDYVSHHTGLDQDERPRTARPRAKKDLVGVDVFLDWHDNSPTQLAETIQARVQTDDLRLVSIANRGVKVWPGGAAETMRVDHWCCRFLAIDKTSPVITHQQVIQLLQGFEKAGLDFIKTEHLCNFDGKPGYSG